MKKLRKNTSKNLDKIRARRTRELFKIDWRDPTRYDIVLNTSRTSVETAAQPDRRGFSTRGIPADCRVSASYEGSDNHGPGGGYAHSIPSGNFEPRS